MLFVTKLHVLLSSGRGSVLSLYATNTIKNVFLEPFRWAFYGHPTTPVLQLPSWNPFGISVSFINESVWQRAAREKWVAQHPKVPNKTITTPLQRRSRNASSSPPTLQMLPEHPTLAYAAKHHKGKGSHTKQNAHNQQQKGPIFRWKAGVRDIQELDRPRASCWRHGMITSRHRLYLKLWNHFSEWEEHIVTPLFSMLLISHEVFLHLSARPGAISNYVSFSVMARDYWFDWSGQ